MMRPSSSCSGCTRVIQPRRRVSLSAASVLSFSRYARARAPGSPCRRGRGQAIGLATRHLREPIAGRDVHDLAGVPVRHLADRPRCARSSPSSARCATRWRGWSATAARAWRCGRRTGWDWCRGSRACLPAGPAPSRSSCPCAARRRALRRRRQCARRSRGTSVTSRWPSGCSTMLEEWLCQCSTGNSSSERYCPLGGGACAATPATAATIAARMPAFMPRCIDFLRFLATRRRVPPRPVHLPAEPCGERPVDASRSGGCFSITSSSVSKMKRPYQISIDRWRRRSFMVARLDTLTNGWARSPLRVPSRRGADACGALEACADFLLKDETPMIRTITRVALMALLVAAGAGGLQAQTTTGGLTGVIRDSDGGVVPGATVNATATATGTTLTAVTDEAGQYLLRGLPVGSYAVQVELAGFQTVNVEGVVVRVNEEVRLDVALKVGNLTESVTVSGISTTVDTVSSTLKTVVDQKRIEELPLNGRNPTQLMQLVAGVIPDNRTERDLGRDLPGRGRRVVQRRARQLDQLHHGRRVEQRPLQQRLQPDAQPGRPAGVLGPDQLLQRPVRPQRRRDRERRHALGHQQFPRARLRLPARLVDERQQLLHAGDRRRPEPQAVRRHVRRADRQEQDVLLRVLPGHAAGPAPGRSHVAGADRRPAQRRLLRLLARPA